MLGLGRRALGYTPRYLQTVQWKYTTRLWSTSLWRNSRSLPDPTPQEGMKGVPGMLGVDGVHVPEDFERLSRKAQDVIYTSKDEIVSLGSQPMNLDNARRILFLLDRMSENICSIVDVAEAGRQIVTHGPWIEIFSKVYG